MKSLLILELMKSKVRSVDLGSCVLASGSEIVANTSAGRRYPYGGVREGMKAVTDEINNPKYSVGYRTAAVAVASMNIPLIFGDTVLLLVNLTSGPVNDDAPPPTPGLTT